MTLAYLGLAAYAAVAGMFLAVGFNDNTKDRISDEMRGEGFGGDDDRRTLRRMYPWVTLSIALLWPVAFAYYFLRRD